MEANSRSYRSSYPATCAAPLSDVRRVQEEVAIKIIDLEQFNTNWDEIRVSCHTTA